MEASPDVAVLAPALPLLNGVDLTRQIRTRLARTEVVIFTQHNAENLKSSLVQAGARGCVRKSEPMRHLIEAVQSAADQKPYFTSAIGTVPKRSEQPLTEREREGVRLVAEGYSNKAVANLLCICCKTVDAHRPSIMRTRAAELVCYAVSHQITAA